jgi:GNAT superfamily N-acetyltransferase
MVTAYSDAGELHGAVFGWLQFGWLYVNMLWVDEPLRRRGIGRALLENIEACATVRGVCRSRLATSDFQPGHALYLQHGYQVYATIPIMRRATAAMPTLNT